MKGIRLAILEVKRFRGPSKWLIPVAMALVPLLYGSLYLWSNWDPFGRTGEIPVAVVIEDEPVTVAGEYLAAGEQFAQQLRATGLFDWTFTDAAEARHGLEHGDYYFTITVPKDFSAKLVSAANPPPEQASMSIMLNDANNFVVGTVASVTQTELQSQVNSAAHAAYANAIYSNLSQVKQQLNVATEGLHRLVDSASLAQMGTSSLVTGLDGARAGSAQISDGVRQLASAGEQTQQILDELSNEGTAALPSAAGALTNTIAAVEQSLGLVANGTGLVRGQASTAAGDLQQLAATYPQIAQDPLFARVMSGAHGLEQSAVNADESASGALNSARLASEQAGEFQSSLVGVQQAVRSLDQPLRALTGSTQLIAGGATGITTGLDSLHSGAENLQTGADQLHGGLSDVSQTVDEGVQKIPETTPEETARASDVLGSPVEVQQENLNPADVYGRGFAPFFFPVAIWVLGVLGYLFFQPVNLRALSGHANSFSIAVGGWLPVAAVSAVGALILYGVVWVGLGLDPLQPLVVAGLLVLGGAAFMAIDHLLKIAFGMIGSALSLVLLIVQLTACGGLYPIETTPAPFQAVHPFIPMTYLVDGLRVGISGGLTSNVIRDVLVLTAFLVGSLLFATLAIRLQRAWTMTRLHPQIAV
ncbi:YhgE/Pip family protein [Rhodococcus sp. NPDC058521]|uniref:YhgE/Pip family protein n=1 Tax=Rhodococcus sp. NPDC058521 TaxID=3346536 RepID=UPI0036518ACB